MRASENLFPETIVATKKAIIQVYEYYVLNNKTVSWYYIKEYSKHCSIKFSLVGIFVEVSIPETSKFKKIAVFEKTVIVL